MKAAAAAKASLYSDIDNDGAANLHHQQQQEEQEEEEKIQKKVSKSHFIITLFICFSTLGYTIQMIYK